MRMAELCRNMATKNSIYMRKFPKYLIPFTSSQGMTELFLTHIGKKMFQQCHMQGYMDSYFALSEHFATQAAPEYCGPGTLVVILNTLKIDPLRQWKG